MSFCSSHRPAFAILPHNDDYSRSVALTTGQDHKNIETRIQMWALAGPMLVAAALLVCLVKMRAPLYLPAIGLIGIPVCWKWKMPGLFGLVATLIAYLAITYSGVEVHERFWHVGTTLSIALALVVTTLALEEVEALSRKLRVESESRLDTLVRVDDKLRDTQQSWQEDRRDLLARLQAATKEVDDKRTRISTFQRVISIVRQDLDAVGQREQQLLKRLYDSDVRCQQLEQTVCHLEVAAAGKGDPAMRAVAQERLDQLNEARSALFQLRLDAKRLANKRDTQDVSAARESIGAGSRVDVKLKANIDSLCDAARETRRTEARYQQLREQFEEKKAVLEATRRELFHARERCLAYEHEEQEVKAVSFGDCELILEKYLLQSAREQECEEADRDVEIAALESLVGELMAQLKQAHA